MPTCRTPPLARHSEPTAWARPNTRRKSPSLSRCSSIHSSIVDNQVGAPFPAPHRPIVRVNDRAGAAEAAIQKDVCGSVGDGRRMRPNQPSMSMGESVVDERGRGFGGKALALIARHDAVGDLDHSGGVRRTLESRTADDATTLAMDHEKPVTPRIGAGGIPQCGEPTGRHFIRYVTRAEAIGRGQAE